jgi:hypothetical protein
MRNLPRKTSVIQTIFTLELDHQPLLEIIWTLPHDLGITALKDIVSRHLDVTLTSVGPKSRLRSEVDKLPPKVSLVLGNILVKRRGKSRIVPSSCFGVVVDKVHSCSRSESHLPSRGQRAELRYSLGLDRHVALSGTDNSQELLTTGVDPCGGSGVVVDKVRSSLGSEPLFPSSG